MASTVIGVILVVWTALAGWTAAQQQQPAALPSALADEVFTIIARAVQQELWPVVSKLESQVESLDKTVRRHESRMESLDNRMTLLDSRVTELTTNILRSRQSEQMDELSTQLTGITARLDSQQSLLSELNTRLSEQKSQQDETAATVNNVTAQLGGIVKQQGDQLAQTSQLATRLDSQESQLNEQKSQQEETAAAVNNLTAQLDSIVTQQGNQLTQLASRLDSQLSQLSELNNQLNEQKSQQVETAAAVNNLTGQLDSIVTQQGDQLAQTSQLARRLDSQESQLNELNVQLNEQKTTQSELSIRVDNLDNLTSQVDVLGYKLTEAINNISSQQERIGDLATKFNHLSLPRDCSGLPVDSPSGVYLLRPSDGSQQPPVQAYCDMETVGGRWTVIQRRDNIEPRQDFYLGWKEYKEGFGNVTLEFWWGLEHLFQLTSYRQYELRIDLEAFDGSQRYATYQQFRISSEEDGYTLSASDYSGTAGDGLYPSVNEKFSTRDRDQDSSFRHCAQVYKGAWWYYGCGYSNLNGRYRDGGDDITGIWWRTWRDEQSLKKSEMKIRPT
ncbi:angiopoietin-related protein 7-like [Amphibalanus amphitrite]|uniref:angiopoietin-related protein 7-like n=1 Tax=Amphibalanus amphitrite TaxID=1232801 RepID=UPI001C90FEB7|nr:angiopoietin-related protein 7-like [Amphibalanus amphitrite]